MKLNIMTWNCDLYLENPSSPNWMRYNSIVNIVKGRLELENSMVVLQEIPYMSNKTWQEHPLYLQMVKDFPEDKYRMVFSIAAEKQIMMTVIIFKKSVFDDYLTTKKNNRIAYCRIEDIILVGVHLPTAFQIERGDDEKKKSEKRWKESVWNDLIEFAKEKKVSGDKIIIIGDFNAFSGCKDALTEMKFIELHRYANDIISDDIPTYNGGVGTPIDHVFVNFNTKLKYRYCIEENFEWSDHKYITVEFDF